MCTKFAIEKLVLLAKMPKRLSVYMVDIYSGIAPKTEINITLISGYHKQPSVLWPIVNALV